MSQLSGNQMFRKLNDLMRNVVPGKDLTSSDSYLRDGHDSAFESTQQMNSQMNNSQYEFSQINSQDLFTQQYSSGSQSEVSMPAMSLPNRRPSMYDKWMSKGPSGSLYKGPQGPADSKPNSYPSKPHSVPSKPDLNPQQFQLNKNKAKERDERDLLQQVATVVQDCTKEESLSLEKVTFLSLALIVLITHIPITSEEQKDATITQLEKQLEDRIENNNENMIKTLKKEIKEPTLALDKKVDQVIEWMNEDTETSNQQIMEYKQQTEIQKKLNIESRQKQQKNIKDTEFRILEELNVMKRDLKYREENWQKQCIAQLHHVQEGQFRNLQKQLVNVMEKNRNKGTGNGNSANTNLQAEVIEEIFKSQWQSVEIFLESQFNRQIDIQEQQLDRLLDKFTETQEKSVDLAQKEPDYRLSLPYFEEHFSKYHSDVKKQIEDLHQKHQSEILRIEEELKQQRLAKEKEETHKSTSLQVVPSLQTLNKYLAGSKQTSSSAFDRAKTINPPPRQYPKPSGYTLPPTKHSPFSSYGPLNSRTLFSKSHPSPIAAVLPQRKEVGNFSLTRSVAVPSNPEPLHDIPSEDEESQAELFEDFVETEEEEKPIEELIKPVENKPQAKKGKKRKKRKGTFSRKKAKTTTKNCATRKSMIERELGITEVSEEWQKPRTLRSSTIKTNEPSKGGQMTELHIRDGSKLQSNLMVNTTAAAISSSSSNQNKPNSHQTKHTINGPKSLPEQNQAIVSQIKPIYNQNNSVYDFEDECQPSSFSFRNPQPITYDRRLLNNDKPKQFNENNREAVYNSPTRRSICTYGTSRESSPSMSLTEVVIKRKIKCDNKKTPDLRNFNHAQTYNYEQCSQISRRDILGSSPTLDIFSKPSRDLQDETVEPSMYSAPTRNVTEKHGTSDSNYVEITESIRRRTQKRYFQSQNYEE
ncbi:hypothetical protein LOTGIDRAFT_173559 [Lottia gigantea]|uniref:Uncharacterized protein n=1 Tax=Lottia gigantea TaxID=225164 RepID=V4B0M9_LOTGI|nr:hypothetical protein LOTGIDRAFT_173559 [Lottia gigantea]ESO99721.1 hypothetical protein LOTGIDRAFT_173559 [Lottia gigantea]